MQKAFLRIREFRIEFPDGAVFAMGKFETVDEGWVVKIKGQQNFEGVKGMHKAFEIAIETTGEVAAWKDGETELWDVVEIFDNEAEATAAGLVNEQMSIYQIETGRLKWLV